MAVIHENDGCVASWETDGCKVPMRLFRWGGGAGEGGCETCLPLLQPQRPPRLAGGVSTTPPCS